MRKSFTNGISLLEMLITISIMGILATALVPMMSQDTDQKLNVAAEETANLLRYALSEQQRTGGFIVIDGRSAYGTLKLYRSNSNAQLNTAITDPVSKKNYEVTPANHAFSNGVDLQPYFRAGGFAYEQLLIRPNNAPRFEVFDGVGVSKGALEANSSIQLRYGSQLLTIKIDEATGLISIG